MAGHPRIAQIDQIWGPQTAAAACTGLRQVGGSALSRELAAPMAILTTVEQAGGPYVYASPASALNARFWPRSGLGKVREFG